jgi:peptidoglycan hydrolase CwlO-like protein
MSALAWAIGLGLLAILSVGAAIWLGLQYTQLRKRMQGIPDLDEEKSRLGREVQKVGKQIEELRGTYKEKYATFDRLKSELAIYDERLSFAELGVYEPHFEFQDSDSFKHAIKEIREQQKAMVRDKTAVVCSVPWTVDGSKAKGRTMINRQIRLTLRAFNNECEAAIANTRWNNVNAMEKRIERAKDQIDNMNASQSVVIVQSYLQLKLKELWLTHEYREMQKREKDERAEAARFAREEAKLIKDAERAAKEEAKYQALLDKARSEVASAEGADVEQLNAKIAALEASLAEAHEEAERATSMAQMTKSGYVYIISNIGSFGEDIVKIGLTRRLDPEDRVRELGDASVPFKFDTHAMIYSEDAPALEAALHSEFDADRVNAANYRKEFFRTNLDSVEAAVKRLQPDAVFFKDREAQEYHETLARRHQEAKTLAEQAAAEIPPEI